MAPARDVFLTDSAEGRQTVLHPGNCDRAGSRSAQCGRLCHRGGRPFHVARARLDRTVATAGQAARHDENLNQCAGWQTANCGSTTTRSTADTSTRRSGRSRFPLQAQLLASMSGRWRKRMHEGHAATYRQWCRVVRGMRRTRKAGVKARWSFGSVSWKRYMGLFPCSDRRGEERAHDMSVPEATKIAVRGDDDSPARRSPSSPGTFTGSGRG